MTAHREGTGEFTVRKSVPIGLKRQTLGPSKQGIGMMA